MKKEMIKCVCTKGGERVFYVKEKEQKNGACVCFWVRMHARVTPLPTNPSLSRPLCSCTSSNAAIATVARRWCRASVLQTEREWAHAHTQRGTMMTLTKERRLQGVKPLCHVSYWWLSLKTSIHRATKMLEMRDSSPKSSSVLSCD